MEETFTLQKCKAGGDIPHSNRYAVVKRLIKKTLKEHEYFYKALYWLLVCVFSTGVQMFLLFRILLGFAVLAPPEESKTRHSSHKEQQQTLKV